MFKRSLFPYIYFSQMLIHNTYYFFSTICTTQPFLHYRRVDCPVGIDRAAVKVRLCGNHPSDDQSKDCGRDVCCRGGGGGSDPTAPPPPTLSPTSPGRYHSGYTQNYCGRWPNQLSAPPYLWRRPLIAGRIWPARTPATHLSPPLSSPPFNPPLLISTRVDHI